MNSKKIIKEATSKKLLEAEAQPSKIRLFIASEDGEGGGGPGDPFVAVDYDHAEGTAVDVESGEVLTVLSAVPLDELYLSYSGPIHDRIRESGLRETE